LLYGSRMDARDRGYVVVSPEALPLAGASLQGNTLWERYDTNDWRRAIAWLRARTPYVACRFEGDNHYYWLGEGHSPEPDELPPLNDRILGHVDLWLNEAVRLHEQLERLTTPPPAKVTAREETLPPDVVVPPGGGWVTWIETSEEPRTATGSARIVTPEPHRLAGWWAAASSLSHRNPRDRAAASLSLPHVDSGPWIHFERGEVTGEAHEIDCVTHDLGDAQVELADLGGQVLGRTGDALRIADPEGNVAILRATAVPFPATG
jgi:hypothetical protein